MISSVYRKTNFFISPLKPKWGCQVISSVRLKFKVKMKKKSFQSPTDICWKVFLTWRSSFRSWKKNLPTFNSWNIYSNQILFVVSYHFLFLLYLFPKLGSNWPFGRLRRFLTKQNVLAWHKKTGFACFKLLFFFFYFQLL
jgi:hypothetical protein